MIILLLIHPHLARIMETAVGFAPRQVLSLALAGVCGTVLETAVLVREMLGIGLSVVGEFVVPDKAGTRVFGDV